MKTLKTPPKNNLTSIMNHILLMLFLVVGIYSCKQKEKDNNLIAPSFKEVWGKDFTEVRRTYESGLSFNDFGYQLEPIWKFTILSDTSVNIYSPQINKFQIAHIQFDHDSIFNFAWSWLRLRKLTKDSIIFQVIKVKDREIFRLASKTYITFYANDYIKNSLHSTPKDLIKPSKADSVFIRKKVLLANSDTSEAFPARNQARLKSRNKLLRIEHSETMKDDKLKQNHNDYLLPEYYITIEKSYKKFSYSFSAVVDEKGRLLFRKSRNFMMPEFEASSNKNMRGIVDGYLSAYLDITPGETLGMAHSSIIIIHVTGQ
ncbi:MAG: hypothetical protein H7Y07_05490 [Pyrinomonadaceae bacterium]|nr:hypothetical protein [Sphingobacteriaceae bacterium]